VRLTTEERISVIEKNAGGKSYREVAEIAGTYIEITSSQNHEGRSIHFIFV
jgi:hypothetical protein